MFSNKIVIILICSFLLAGSVFLGILSWQNITQKQEPQVNIEENPGHLTEPKNDGIVGTPPTKPIEEVKKEDEIQWLAEPVKLEDLKLVEYEQNDGSNRILDVQYYKVANLADGGEVVSAYVLPDDMMGETRFAARFKKTVNGKFSLIKQNSDINDLDNFSIISNAPINSETVYASLIAPQKIKINNAEFALKDWSDKTPLDWNKLDKIGTTDYGDFFKKLFPSDFNLSFVDYELRLPDSSAVSYSMNYDFLADDNTLIATFNSDNQVFKEKKFNTVIRRGCSVSSDEIYLSDLSERLSPIGNLASGVILYIPKNSDDEIYKVIFDSYKIGRDGTTSFDGKPVLTYEEFVAKKPALVWQDALGDYHVFSDSEYSALAECGKPVIYLYPEATTEVRVRVGAEVRISEPDYGEGWKVTANPDGKIINSDGVVYENLYWEGLGYGNYPRITEGRVVKGENIKIELKSDLAVLGLNEKEAADFMEFWLPKMPETAYIRLTWLDTAEINELAPLAISPRPDTVQRVFLDFSGQDTSATNLAPQKLKGFSREGFTVVEWGGLLIGNK